ncbi:MAG: hypothetical protein QGH94_01205 [Phycisphaerae bacterium]|jgi:hypothetical protein|nr:hypothetical protein [Phycisphaerae bacterium]MDP7286587.1 hypothetical protein [Phycisphaerae bacterium]
MQKSAKRRRVIPAAGIAGAVSVACVVFAFVLCTRAQVVNHGKVKIALVDAKGDEIKSSTSGKLELDRKYQKGDRIEITWAEDIVVKIDEHVAETIVFAPQKHVPDRPKVIFPIPLWQTGHHPEILPYNPKAFVGKKHVITARAAKAKEVAAYRNVALNPIDPRGTSTFFPHASSNSEWGDAAIYAARNAIDGCVQAEGDHHDWPRQSWGPYLPEDHPKPELLVEFGREAEIDKIAVVVRFNENQYNHWKEATVEFSDGSKEKIKIKYNGKRQEFKIKKRTVTSMRFKTLVSETEGGYAAFVEVEAWGKVTQ